MGFFYQYINSLVNIFTHIWGHHYLQEQKTGNNLNVQNGVGDTTITYSVAI